MPDSPGFPSGRPRPASARTDATQSRTARTALAPVLAGTTPEAASDRAVTLTLTAPATTLRVGGPLAT